MRIFKFFLVAAVSFTVLFVLGRTIIGDGNIQRGDAEVTGMLKEQFSGANGFTAQLQGNTAQGMAFQAQATYTPEGSTVAITSPLHLADTTYTVKDGTLSVSRDGQTYTMEGRLSGKPVAMMLRSPAFVLGLLQNSTPNIEDGLAFYHNEVVDGQQNISCEITVDCATQQPIAMQLSGGGSDCTLSFSDFTLTQSSS